VSLLMDRVAGAPITWGVCEVEGWGPQLDADRVLREMATVGLRATELGPEGYLPTEPQQLRALLDSNDLQLVGGFVPVVLHIQDRLSSELVRAAKAADLLAAGGAGVLVLAAALGKRGYDQSAELEANEWQALISGIDRMIEIASERALSVALHPHHGTVVEGPDDVRRVLETSPVSLCIDTGHLMIGGADPATIVDDFADRVSHVHLKDVARELAEQVKSAQVGYHDAVRRGMYRPLGEGDIDVAEIIRVLERSGYRGWYVLEQDAVLETVPEAGAGPIRQAAASLEYLRMAQHTETSAHS
jgi:inosose dehydratase